MTFVLQRDYETPHGRLRARVLYGRVQPGVVWSIECPECDRDSGLTGPELHGKTRPMCATAGCHGIPQADYARALDQAIGAAAPARTTRRKAPV